MFTKYFCLALFLAAGLRGVGPSFVPDSTFKGSSLEDWRPLGNAKWRATNGQLTGKSQGQEGAGWLLSNRSLQDTGLYFQFRCTGPCNTGVLLRAQQSAAGMQGVFVSITDDGMEAYHLRLDASGKELERTKLRPAGGQIRFAPPAAEAARMRRPGGFPAPPPMPGGIANPVARPVQGVQKGQWNAVEILLDADIVRGFLDDGGGEVSAATEGMDSYGPVALYVGPGSEVCFQDVAYKDLALKTSPLEQVGPGFRMQRLSPYYYSWSADAADFNHDGKIDVVSGPFIYFGPDYTKNREIYPAQAYNVSTQYSMKDWVQHAYDFTGDGWADVLTTSHAGGGKDGAVLYVNPKGEARRWEEHKIVPVVQSEATLLKDVDGDGKPELVYEAEGYMRYAKPDPANPTAEWVVHTVSEKGPWTAHGIGAGDVNGDRRLDILGSAGWWEQPASEDGDKSWRYHPQAFGRWTRESAGGGEIGVYDVNGDGLNDVVTSLQAHGWGLAWFEQKRAANGDISFVEHMIMDDHSGDSAKQTAFSELHGTAIADVDGDGIPDFIVGKRFWSHLDDYYDPDPYGPAVLYWFKTVRSKKTAGGAELQPRLIHNWSGAGSDVLAKDLNGDGAVDIVTATRSGTYIFWGKRVR